MNRKPGIPARWPAGLVSVTLTALLGILLLVTPAGNLFERLSYDLPFAFRSDIPVEEVILVQMDEESHKVLGQPGDAPWDRSLHARLIDRLTALNAKAIVFDVLFLGERDSIADAQLVQATKASGRVTLAAQMTTELSHGELVGWRLIRPFPALAEVARCGVVEQADQDGSVRQHYWNPQYTNALSLAQETARATMQCPPGPGGARWLNYYGPPGWISRLSYYEIFNPNSDLKGVISNKVVFVGAGYTVGFTQSKSRDQFRTPYTRWTGRLSSGVEVVATAYVNLLRGDWLARPGPIQECTLMLIAALVLGLGLVRCRPVVAISAAALLALVVASVSYALIRQNVFFPWLIIVGAQIPFALVFALWMYTVRLQRDKRVLEQRLVLTTAAEVARAVAGTTSVLSDRIVGALRTQADNEAPTLNDEAPIVPDHKVLRQIGRGGYGQVWLARDILGYYHAVKALRRHAFRSDGPLEREFEGLKRFTPISRAHPNLVQILHVGRGPDGIFYVMEAADDESTGQTIDPERYFPRTLASLLRQRRRLSVPECLDLGANLAAALEFLHERQLIHCDVKPSNIIFVNDTPKLADIGLVADIARSSTGNTFVGTPGYMPPEGPGAPAGDLYSLGKLLYEAAFGLDCTRFPDLPRTMVEQAEEGVFDLNRVLLKACENNPARRYCSARQLREELLRLRNDQFASIAPLNV